MTEHFTFREECISKYDEEVYQLIMASFDAMPLSCLVSEKYLCMHGGISPELKKMDQINKIKRFKETPLDGLFCDLLWSDPMDDEKAQSNDYMENQERECSYVFGKKPARKVIEANNLMSIVRAHQVQLEGFKMHRWEGEALFPSVITLFSAPNYCDYYSNKASVLILENGGVSIKQYDQVDHPYHLPDQIDVFTWSIPFVADKVATMLKHVLKKTAGKDSDEEEDGEQAIKALTEEGKKK